MDRVFVKNYVLFLCVLVLGAGALIYVLIYGNFRIEKTGARVTHAHDVIVTAEQLSMLVEGMVASQRGYLVTGQEGFLEAYEGQKGQLSEKIALISTLTADNPAHASRLEEMRNYKTQLTTRLEERASQYRHPTDISPEFLDGIRTIDSLKQNIMRLNSAVLEEEYGLLGTRVQSIEAQKTRYFTFLLMVVIASSGFLMLFNGFLLHSQRKRARVEDMLEDTEKRFTLAVEGTRDGIYDWDLTTGQVFYSSRIFKMLGYERESFTGTIEDLKDIIHPEDGPRVWKSAEDYFAGEIPEYSVEYRLKADDGRWVWVHSRARAIKDSAGKPVRLVGAHTDISFIKERQEKLEQEKKAAEDANRAKRDFLAHMSHEIRTPLTAISGIAEIFLNKQGNLDDKQKSLIHTLHSSTAALKDIINDILDFSKIESGELELNRENFRVAGLFEEIISMMSLRARGKAISFVFYYDDIKDCVFYGDRARIRQILINLIGNAIKFTNEGGVTVSAHAEYRNEEPFLRVDISDTGIGIAPENFDLIFERFKQADPGVARKYGGTGLGLPISRHLAELLDGKIILSSQTGKGSTFSLILPDTEKKLSVLPEAHAYDRGNLAQRIRSSVSGDTRILIVEDYEANIMVIGFLLDDAGCAYDVARNGQQAVDMWKEHPYDLLLMDVQMPLMDGFSATAAIRKIEREHALPRTPIIGMTAHALVGDKDKCIEAGMDAYLPKPLIEDDLRQEIFNHIGQKRAAA